MDKKNHKSAYCLFKPGNHEKSTDVIVTDAKTNAIH